MQYRRVWTIHPINTEVDYIIEDETCNGIFFPKNGFVACRPLQMFAGFLMDLVWLMILKTQFTEYTNKRLPLPGNRVLVKFGSTLALLDMLIYFIYTTCCAPRIVITYTPTEMQSDQYEPPPTFFNVKIFISSVWILYFVMAVMILLKGDVKSKEDFLNKIFVCGLFLYYHKHIVNIFGKSRELIIRNIKNQPPRRRIIEV